MNKFILSLVASVVISVTTGCNPVQAECPVPVQSEIMREHKNTTAGNVKTIEKMDAIDKANNGKCLSKFINVGE